MTKEDIVKTTAAATGQGKTAVEAVLNSMLANIKQAVARGEKVTFSGFGVFEPIKKAPRTGRNLRTGEAVPIQGKFTPVFKPCKQFKDMTAEVLSWREGEF